jgi:hypothetical protein
MTEFYLLIAHRCLDAMARSNSAQPLKLSTCKNIGMTDAEHVQAKSLKPQSQLIVGELLI